ncbi:MAG: hypothetical protein J6W98_01410 [Bacteroidales bacterium]|nr:hypothetical protein [Bacteroidales bacterium]
MKKLQLKKVTLAEMPSDVMLAVNGGEREVEKVDMFLPTLISILSLPLPPSTLSISICISMV